MNTKTKVLNKIYLWVRRAIKDNHLSIHHNDIKCENCNEWFSISGVRYSHEYDSLDFGYSVRCGQCGHKSYWNTIYFPMPVLAFKDGEPK